MAKNGLGGIDAAAADAKIEVSAAVAEHHRTRKELEMQAESYDYNNRKVFAWSVKTTTGKIRTWAATEDEARNKVAKTKKVISVKPAQNLV
jgi:hypothetical protein